ncbi:hypothetical protein [Limosilactobacillus reuteri]|nr:hypothetical protein [Limosilactobacillus reuteri]MQB59883.1 hypothetical protein [Limosilactobacillus reuteri]MQB83309.1 hypothetical protein [Limosilactobacillus reuteri]
MVSIIVKEENIAKIKNFAKDMAEKGYQKEKRTGGTEIRSKGQIYNNILEGRFAEYAFYQHVTSIGRGYITKPNLEEWARGEWDEGIDFKQKFHNHHYITEIKASSNISRLILLTAGDLELNEKGKEIFEHGESCPDFIIGAKVDLETKNVEFAGFLYKADLRKALINPEEYLWKKGEFIPGTKKRLDADNYIWVYPQDSSKVNKIGSRHVNKTKMFPDHRRVINVFLQSNTDDFLNGGYF